MTMLYPIVLGHSRGYGLHSINPFGLHDFLNDQTQDGSLTLEAGQHVRFR